MITEADVMNLIREASVAGDLKKLTDSTPFTDVGIDSLDMANIFLGIEEIYGVKIPDEEIQNLQTVRSLVSFVNQRRQG